MTRDEASAKEPLEMRCQQAMWWGYGAPAGVCGEPAYGPASHMRTDPKYWTCAEIARCPKHGGPSIDEFKNWLIGQINE